MKLENTLPGPRIQTKIFHMVEPESLIKNKNDGKVKAKKMKSQNKRKTQIKHVEHKSKQNIDNCSKKSNKSRTKDKDSKQLDQ